MIRGVSSARAISTRGIHIRGFVHGEQGELKLNRQRQNQVYYSTILQSRQVDPPTRREHRLHPVLSPEQANGLGSIRTQPPPHQYPRSPPRAKPAAAQTLARWRRMSFANPSSGGPSDNYHPEVQSNMLLRVRRKPKATAYRPRTKKTAMSWLV